MAVRGQEHDLVDRVGTLVEAVQADLIMDSVDDGRIFGWGDGAGQRHEDADARCVNRVSECTVRRESPLDAQRQGQFDVFQRRAGTEVVVIQRGNRAAGDVLGTADRLVFSDTPDNSSAADALFLGGVAD